MCIDFGSGETLLNFGVTGHLIPQNYKPIAGQLLFHLQMFSEFTKSNLHFMVWAS